MCAENGKEITVIHPDVAGIVLWVRSFVARMDKICITFLWDTIQLQPEYIIFFLKAQAKRRLYENLNNVCKFKTVFTVTSGL